MKIIIIIILIAFSIGCIFMVFKILNFRGDDFKIYYNTSMALNSHKNIYQPYLIADQKELILAEYNYPPFISFILTPFTMFSFNTAKNVWYFFNLLFFIGSIVLSFLIINRKPNLFHLGIILLISSFSAPVFLTFYYGQVNILVFFLILLCFYFYKNNKIYISSILLALAVLIKIFPLFFLIYFVTKRDFKFIAFFVISFFVLLIISITFSWDYYLNLYKIYLLKVLPVMSVPSAALGNQSLGGFIARLFIPNPHLDSIFSLPRLGIIIYKIIVVLCIIFSLILLAKREINEDLSFCISFLFIMILIVSPLSWIHYYVFLIFTLIYSLYNIKKNNLDKITLTIIFLLVWFVFDRKSLFFREGLKVLFLSNSFYGLLGLLFLITKNKLKNYE